MEQVKLSETSGSEQARAAKRFLRRSSKTGGLGGKKLGGRRTGNRQEINAMIKRNTTSAGGKRAAKRLGRKKGKRK